MSSKEAHFLNEPIVVPELSVRVVTGEPADDPHGQGFSAIFAEIVTTDQMLITALSSVELFKDRLTLRCAMLDVIGPVTKIENHAGGKRFVLSVEDLCYQKPKHFWEK